MTNAKQSFPQINIIGRDEVVRSFCLNLGAFRALEEHMSEKTENPDYSILEDFDWTSNKIETLSLILWAGLYTDAIKRGENLTIVDAEDLVSLIGLKDARSCIEESLKRVMTPKQLEKLQEASSVKKKKAQKKIK